MKGLLSLGSILLASCLPAFAADLPELNIYQLQPVLVDGNGMSVGIFTGPAISYSNDGIEVKAFGLMSPNGHMAALLPGGELGGAKSIYFEAHDCRGQPHVLSINTSNVVNTYLPGFVFAFGEHGDAYYIPKNSLARHLALNSILSATDKGVRCENSTLSSNTYPVVLNDVNETGIPDNGFAGVSVAAKSLREERLRQRKRPPFYKPPEGGISQPFNANQAQETCSPGCDSDMISNGYCDSECNNRACGYDSNDCTALEIENAIRKEEAQCAPLCEIDDLGDGFCDRACNNDACEYDRGDCPVN